MTDESVTRPRNHLIQSTNRDTLENATDVLDILMSTDLQGLTPSAENGFKLILTMVLDAVQYIRQNAAEDCI